jgi:hypothetical protein
MKIVSAEGKVTFVAAKSAEGKKELAKREEAKKPKTEKK